MGRVFLARPVEPLRQKPAAPLTTQPLKQFKRKRNDVKASFSSYDFAKSRERIDEILDSKDTNYDDKDSIPSRVRLSSDREMMASNVFYENLNDNNKRLLAKNANRDCYHGYVFNTEMNDWLKEQK